MPTNKLKDAHCRGAAPGDTPRKLFDGGGLYLYVLPTGVKLWRIAYRYDGKQKTLSLGAYPDVSLADARQKLADAKALLRAGKNPREVKHAPCDGVSFRAAAENYWRGREDLSAGYIANALRALEMHLYREIGGKAVGEIARAELLDSLRRLDDAGKHVYVRKVRMWASQVFDWAVENGHAEHNPAAQIKPEKAFGHAKVESFAALALRDVPDFLERIALEKDLDSVLACRMLALTWVRMIELRMMEWEEIDGDVWSIPAGKMKRRNEHLVPLSRQALALLEKMRRRAAGSSYVFPSPHRLDRPLSENAILTLIARIGYKGRMTGHGWRSVGSTWANEHGWNPDAIERQLAHVPDNKIRAVYNRAEYLPQRKEMMQAWADWLMPESGEKNSNTGNAPMKKTPEAL